MHGSGAKRSAARRFGSRPRRPEDPDGGANRPASTAKVKNHVPMAGLGTLSVTGNLIASPPSGRSLRPVDSGRSWRLGRGERIWRMRRRFVVVAFVLVVVGGAVVVYRGRHSDLGEYGAVFVVSRAGAGLRQLTNDQRFHESEAWSPDGRSIVLTTKSVDAHGIDIRGPLEFLHPSGGKAKEVWL